jgi:sugar phosphate isomerase/epimerase
VHTITTRPWSLEEVIEGYSRAGIPAITVWRQAFESSGAGEAAKLLKESGLRVTSLCRGGFFPAPDDTGRRKAIDDNLRAIEEAATIGAPLIVLVCGAVPGMPLEEGRRQIREGIEAILPEAEKTGVRLSIEPLHPMYADCRSAVVTLGQANDIIEAINHANLGVTVDVYHLWWDHQLEDEISRAGHRIFSYHVSDWRTPTRNLLNDREIMGRGCIPFKQIRAWVERAGFTGDIEVEIFSREYWSQNQSEFLEKITQAYIEHC